MQRHESPEKNYDLERLLFFSDGVFAIVITLLALELRPPANWDRTILGLWREEWRSISAFAISFWAVGLFWNSHRILFARIVRFTPGLVFFNLGLLGLVTLLPFASKLIYEGGTDTGPLVLYVGLLAAISLAQAAFWGFAALMKDVVSAAFSARQRWGIFLSMLAAPILLSVWVAMIVANRPTSEWLLVGLCLAAANLLRRRFERNPAAPAKA